MEDGRALDPETMRALAKHADVLGYGCGTGVESIRLAPTCRSGVGIDISGAAIEQATAADAIGFRRTRSPDAGAVTPLAPL